MTKMTPMQRVEVLKAACCVAGIDGSISDTERELINKIARAVGVGRASLEAMIERATKDPNFHKTQFQILNDNPKQCLTAVLEVALADGSVSEAETGVLRNLSDNLKIPATVFEELMENVAKMG